MFDLETNLNVMEPNGWDTNPTDGEIDIEELRTDLDDLDDARAQYRKYH